MTIKTENKKYLELWEEYKANAFKSSPVDKSETPSEKRKRITYLEAHPEKWFKYHFSNFYTSEPAPFHLAATKRILKNAEWYEVRSWSRELSKSGRTMMEVLFLVLTGRKKNVLMVSNTKDNAERLLLPYKLLLETSETIINDYGVQQKVGKWEADEFVTKKGASFRALGAGQSPRGTRNDAVRPDVILIDDIDTDEECRNKKRIKAKVKWINEALYATRSVSEPLLWIACGNLIAKFCCITEMAKVADKHEIINIRDKDGNSTWPQKNTEALIDRTLSKIPWSAQQKEYYNNPVSEGDTFKEITWGVCPPLKSCDHVIIYADPSTSNKDRGKSKQASHKGVVIVGAKGRKRYVYKVWLDQTNNANFVDWLYEAYEYIKEKGVDSARVHVENNSLQDPHYTQVLLPLVYQKADEYGYTVPITPDTRKKPDKFFRIEGTLEPLNRLGNLIFNIAQKKEPNMVRMVEQMLGVSEDATVMDGPDALEGGCWLLNKRTVRTETSYAMGAIANRKY
ncbi:hypothetical protein FHR24_001489 [Wenyingzhuangia heitensis]|uniref:Terminase large subunit gp17-like C-terminal domain-containing protein n=1 Tax=Wenyingzhuangia heitensis TaxID=1487859 RepID=A0ABX0UAS9_9FLAO|nr:hypothetical protein [Wenyingzhuangia heitensis]NIJ45050.1 hypothetical protein [Wenyingzhuangia heitensis]